MGSVMVTGTSTRSTFVLRGLVWVLRAGSTSSIALRGAAGSTLGLTWTSSIWAKTGNAQRIAEARARNPTRPKTHCLPGMVCSASTVAIEWRFLAWVMGMVDPRPSRRATTARLTPILSQLHWRFVTLLLKNFFVLLTMVGARKSLSRVSRFRPRLPDRTVLAPVQPPARTDYGQRRRIPSPALRALKSRAGSGCNATLRQDHARDARAILRWQSAQPRAHHSW